MGDFQGFSPAALDFYRGIAAHNDTDWFAANRQVFMEEVIGPAQRFIEALGSDLMGLRPCIQYDVNHTGRGSFKKIHTDRRFNKDRPPFKTYAQMIFWEGPLKVRKENACCMVTFDPGRVVLSAGLKYFERGTLKRYRSDVAGDQHGAGLANIVREAQGAGYTVGGSHYKRVPRGTAPDHPRADLLRHNALFAERRFTPEEAGLHSAGFVDFCASHFAAMLPVHDWCVSLLHRGQ